MKNWIQKVLCGDVMAENARLLAENAILRSELINKGSVFFKDKAWLGASRTVFGAVIDGKMVTLSTTHGDT